MKATNASTCTVDAHERVGDYVIILLVRSWYATLYKQRLSYMYTPFFKAAVRTYIGGEGGEGVFLHCCLNLYTCILGSAP